MASNSTNIFQVLNGMKRDFHVMDMQEGMFDYMLNGTIENFDGNGLPIIQNERSNILCTGFPEGYFVIGFVNVVEQNRIIWFLANPETGGSEIGESQHFENCRKYAKDGVIAGSCDDCERVNISEHLPLENITQKGCCVYRTIRNQTCFNFSREFPINSTEYRLLACSLQVFFTDNNNSRRWLEFEYTNDDPSQPLVVKKDFLKITGFNTPPCEDPIYSTDIDCNKMSIQPDAPTPCIDFIDLVGGGSNKAGMYQFFISFADALGNKRSSYFSSTNGIPIRTRDITLNTDYVTDRAISLEIDNLDLFGAFEYYNLAVAKTINGFTSFNLVGTFPITQNKYTYTGNNAAEIKLSADDIFQRVPYYKTASGVTASNNILFWSNPAEFSKPNLQRVANNINLMWQTIAIPEAVYRSARNVNKFRSCMRDEVYPYAIVFIYTNGEESSAYHIPGRAATSTDLEIINNDDVLQDDTCAEQTRNKRWQVYNTATIEGGNLDIYKECEETCYQFGKFAYWESTERYPNIPLIWGNLCGQPIRHPKYPDSLTTHIHNLEDAPVASSGGTYFKNNLVFPIGVKVDHDSVRASIAAAVSGGIISQTEADRIAGYRIVRGNRFKNKSVIAKGILFDVNNYTRKDGSSAIDLRPIYFANYPLNDLRPNSFITDQHNNYKDHDTPQGNDLPFTFSKRYTFQSPDTQFSQPTVGTELKLETSEYGEAEQYFTKCKKQAKQRLLSNSSYFFALTGGIIAALLRTEEKECISYTIKSDYSLQYGDQHVGSSTFNSGQDIEGTGTTTITTINAGGSIGSHTVSQDNSTEKHNNQNFTGFDDTTGIPEPITDVESHTKQTCQGTRIQYFNGLLAFLNPALSVFQTILSFVGSTEDFIRVVLEEMNIILELIKSLTPYRDWTVQRNAVGKYNCYTSVPNNAGQKRRQIVTSSYLKPENTIVPEPVDNLGQFDSIKINNYQRESSLYLKYAGNAFPTPDTVSGVIDKSRITMNDPVNDCALDKRVYTPICSYYASIKNFVPDQYGTIYNIEYLLTDSCTFDINTSNDDCRGIYGGDTFINRFALKIKVPYFLATTFGLPQGTDFDFSDVTNLAFPRHYYNTTLTLGSEFSSIGDILTAIDIFNPNAMFDLYGRPKSIRDCDTSKLFYQNGYIYLYDYGIPYFLCESDVNVDYRTGENNLEKDFYPHQSDLDFWLQEQNVPISEDNFYAYNSDYSKQNKETFIGIDGPKFEPSRQCRVDHPNRIIFATDANWLVYKANDLLNYPLNKGKVVSVDGIENETVLIRTNKGAAVFKSILRTMVDGQTVQTGNGGVFANPPQEFSQTKLGHMGTQHKAILHTEFGHLWVDAQRGQVFNISAGGNGAEDISNDGMYNWFEENLPFRLLRDFPNMPEEHIDNNFLGAGIALSFDKRNKRVFLTKLDYKLKDKNVQYDVDNREFFKIVNSQRVNIKLGDKRYFTNVSWTAAYSFLVKAWISFYSFKPNYYVDFMNYFGSGVSSGFWLHNLTNASFQVFYGKLEPFIIEPIFKFSGGLDQLKSLEFDTEVRRYENEFDYTVKRLVPGFNKAIIYNDLYNSGLLNLIKTDKQDMTLNAIYPKRNLDSWDIEVATANYKWRMNQIYNLARDHSDIPLWLYEGNNADKDLNQQAFNYRKADFGLSRMLGQWFKARFINNQLSNYKIFFKFGTNKKLETKR